MIAEDNDDDDDFKRHLTGVKPLKPQNRVARTRPQTRLQVKPSAPTTHEQPDFLSYTEHWQAHAPDAQVAYFKPGIQFKLQQKIKRGQYPIAAKLDLHQHTIAEAFDATNVFLQQAATQGARLVLLITGKGRSSHSIKNAIITWLEDCPAILGFCTAQNKHGGAGAFYVLLKKTC